MKVGILCPFYRQGAIGGVETVIRHLLDRLPERGFSPSMVPFLLPAGVDFNNPLFSPYLQLKAASAALSRDTSKFDIIHSHHPFVTLPFALRKKTVMSFHVYSGDLYASQNGPHPMTWAQRNGVRIAEFASGMAARESTAVSAYIKSRLVHDVHIPEKKITVIYNGVDLDEIDRAIAAKGESPYRTEGPNILCIGRIWRQKGFDTVIRAMSGESPGGAHLHIAGPPEDSQYVAEMREFASRNDMSGRFHLLGPVSAPQKFALMHHADLVVIPSRFEGMSIVAIEALATSSAIIASDIPPLREVLGDAALFFEAGNADDLAAKMASVLASSANQRRLKSSARERREMFGLDRMVGSYVRAYERAAG